MKLIKIFLAYSEEMDYDRMAGLAGYDNNSK
jgi:hypothetical protein